MLSSCDIYRISMIIIVYDNDVYILGIKINRINKQNMYSKIYIKLLK